MTTPRRALLTALILLTGAMPVSAGNLEPPAPPADPASAMYTTHDLYNRLTTGAAGARRSGPFVEPAAPPGATGHTIDEIMAVMPMADNTTGATAAEVVSGRSFWGLRTDGTWGLTVGTGGSLIPAIGNAVAGDVLNGKTFSSAAGMSTGTMANQGAKSFTPGTTDQAIPAGYYNGTGVVTGDTSLIAGNIKSGVAIFGVTGSYGGGGSAFPFPVGKTGQTSCYNAVGTKISCDKTGQDGALRKGGVPPSPRFTDKGNGTVMDNATGLIWLQNANCTEAVGGIAKTNGYLTWANALVWSNALTSGKCSLNDGSIAGQWRLPNVKELQSLIDFGATNPALPSGHPFTGVKPGYYWTSSTILTNTDRAWWVDLSDGYQGYSYKPELDYVWPVSGGQ